MKKIYLIDGNSFIYRMFYALPEFSTKSGEVVNALFGMAKFFVGQITKEKPDYVCFITDAKGDNFRHQIYADYKATRDRMPDNLRSQIPLIEKMVEVMGFKIITIPNCEADDVIGTLATKFGADQNNDVYILSGDKDLYSLTKSNVKIYDTMKQKIFDYELAKTKFDVNPEHIIDYLAIVGDASDNIPGVEGFGPKKAVDLINTYGTVEQIFEHIEDEDFILKSKTLEKLKSGKEMAFLSKKLATIDLNIDLGNFLISDYEFNSLNLATQEVQEFFKQYEFYSLVNEKIVKEITTFDKLNIKPIIIDNLTSLDNLFLDLKTKKSINFNLLGDSTSPHNTNIVGVGISFEDKYFYVDFLKIQKATLVSFFLNLFNLDIEIVGFNLKYDLKVLNLFLNNEIILNSEILKKDLSSQISFDF